MTAQLTAPGLAPPEPICLYRDATAEVWHCSWAQLAERVEKVDALITDPPYGRRVHAGHDAVSGVWTGEDAVTRREHGYAGWTGEDAVTFVAGFAPHVNGWWCVLESHDLVPAFEVGYAAAGLYSFAPLPCVVTGSRCRLAGDGPNCDTVQAICARPRSVPWCRWGSLPGHYLGPAERGLDRVGGKPLWLMSALVRDYSRPGDLVCDPCCGAGTTGVAARMLGRRFIGCDIDRTHAEIAAKRISKAREQRRFSWG